MTTNATKATLRTRARNRRTSGVAAPAVVSFPNSLLAYLDIALTGPLGPSGVAHRIVRYLVTEVDDHGRSVKRTLIGAACQPTTTRRISSDLDEEDATEETAPATVCRVVSAALAQSLGVTRCTDTACYPVQAGELPGGAR